MCNSLQTVCEQSASVLGALQRVHQFVNKVHQIVTVGAFQTAFKATKNASWNMKGCPTRWLILLTNRLIPRSWHASDAHADRLTFVRRSKFSCEIAFRRACAISFVKCGGNHAKTSYPVKENHGLLQLREFVMAR
jgi:hypothetical protein